MKYRFNILLSLVDDAGKEIAVGRSDEADHREDMALAIIKVLNAFDKRCQEQEESCRPKSRSNSSAS